MTGLWCYRLKSPHVAFEPQLVEAKLALNLIASSDMPSIALDALEADIDGAAIRRLAALEHPTYFEAAEILPRAMEEMGLERISLREAATRMAKRIAQEILSSGDDPMKHTRDFESLWVRAGYTQGLRDLGTLDDEVWIAESTGQSSKDIRVWVTSRLRDFVRS